MIAYRTSPHVREEESVQVCFTVSVFSWENSPLSTQTHLTDVLTGTTMSPKRGSEDQKNQLCNGNQSLLPKGTVRD